MDPTRLLLQDELPAVQDLATDREPTDDPVADVRRARATYLHSLEATAYTREEVWLLEPPEEVLARRDAPPEWLRPSQKQIQAMRSFDIQGWDKMDRTEAGVAIATAIRRWKRGLANYTMVQSLVRHGLLSLEDALKCRETDGQILLAHQWYKEHKRGVRR
jgi:hypothetical protein